MIGSVAEVQQPGTEQGEGNNTYQDKYDIRKIIHYPGFNVPPPSGAYDVSSISTMVSVLKPTCNINECCYEVSTPHLNLLGTEISLTIINQIILHQLIFYITNKVQI